MNKNNKRKTDLNFVFIENCFSFSSGGNLRGYEGILETNVIILYAALIPLRKFNALKSMAVSPKSGTLMNLIGRSYESSGKHLL
jgi:hypothetical protein